MTSLTRIIAIDLPRHASRPRRVTVIRGLIILAGCAVFAPVVPRLIHEWSINGNCTHVPVALPIALLILAHRLLSSRPPAPPAAPASRPPSSSPVGWASRPPSSSPMPLASCPPSDHRTHPQNPHASSLPITRILIIAPLILAALTFTWIDAITHEILAAAICLWLAALVLIALLAGHHALRGSLFPFLLLAFSIPPPQGITQLAIHQWLQQFTATGAGLVLNLFAIDVTVDGTTLSFADASLDVAEPCSGYRFLIAMAFAALLLASLLLPRNPIARSVLLIASIFAALFINTLRLAIAGSIAHARDHHAALDFLHSLWVLPVYALGVVILWLLARSLATHATDRITSIEGIPTAALKKRNQSAHPARPRPSSRLARHRSEAPTHQPAPTDNHPCLRLAAAAIFIALLAGVPLLAHAPLNEPPARTLANLPASIASWQSQAITRHAPNRHYQQFIEQCDDHAIRQFTRPGFSATVHFFYCRSRQPDNRLTAYTGLIRRIHAPWQHVRHEVISPHPDLPVNRLRLLRDGKPATMLYWYASPSRCSAKPVRHLIWQYQRDLLRQRSDGCIIAIEYEALSNAPQGTASPNPESHADAAALDLAAALNTSIQLWLTATD